METIIENALLAQKKGNLKKAKKLYKQALKQSPDNPDCLHLLGRIDLRLGYVSPALKNIKKAIFNAPLKPDFHESLALAYYQSGGLEMAECECKITIRLNEETTGPLNILGLIYRDKGQYDRSIEYFSSAIEKKVPYTDAMNNLATVLIRKGDYQLAEKYLRLILDMEGKNINAWNNLGLALRGQQALEESEKAFMKAGDFPPARFNIGHNKLLKDDLKNGLPLYEYRKKILGIGKEFNRPEWNGEPHRNKKLLVIHEQGLGDTIMMSRFFPQLINYFKKVIIQVQPPLLELMKTIHPELTIVADLDQVSFDYWCPIMSLPYRLKIVSVKEIPQSVWFNIPEPSENKNKLQVGINWAGNPSYKYDAIRSTHLKDLDMLLKIENVDWHSLHKGHLEFEADVYRLNQPLKSVNNFYDTAVFINGLDLVISTETAVPNLSAALGIPTCILAMKDYDWRWRSWYDCAIVCEQERQGNWYGAIYKAIEEIKKKLDNNNQYKTNDIRNGNRHFIK